MTRIPPMIEAIKLLRRGLRVLDRSMIRPETKAPTGQPIRNPAEGDKNSPNPPRPPASNGTPNATRIISKRIAKPPRQAPRMQPLSMTPSVCAVIGTPKPRVMIGINPKAAVSAANKAIYAIFLSIVSPLACVRTSSLYSIGYMICIIQGGANQRKNYSPCGPFQGPATPCEIEFFSDGYEIGN